MASRLGQKKRTVEGKLHEVRMGLGEAIKRLIEVEMRFRQGRGGEAELAERALITQALNQFELDLGFDCNQDGVADTVEIFQQTVSTSCCRILPFDMSRKKATKRKVVSRKIKSTSRKKSTTKKSKKK